MNKKDFSEQKMENVLERVKGIQTGTAGCSIKSEIAASEILKYLKEENSENIRKLADKIYDYYEETSKIDEEINITELYGVCTDCEFILINGTDKILDVDLGKVDYELDDCGKYIDFVSYLNNKPTFEYSTSNEFNSYYSIKNSKMLKNAYDEINNKIKEYDNKTSSLVFTIASLFLGISLVGGIVSGINKTNEKTLLIFISLIAWIVCFTICLSSLLLGINFEKRKKGIYATMIISTAVLALFVFIYFIQTKTITINFLILGGKIFHGL